MYLPHQLEGATGKDVLQELVKSHCAEYQEFTDDEKAELLLEYSEHKDTQATGIRISTKSKVNDVTQTLKAVENEVSPPRIFILDSLTQFTAQQFEEPYWS